MATKRLIAKPASQLIPDQIALAWNIRVGRGRAWLGFAAQFGGMTIDIDSVYGPVAVLNILVVRALSQQVNHSP